MTSPLSAAHVGRRGVRAHQAVILREVTGSTPANDVASMAKWIPRLRAE